jgi:4-hydroxymandelate synthase
MKARDVSHIEIYARDKTPVMRFLVTALGFVRVADSVEVDRSSVLLTCGDVRVVVTSGWATCRSRHAREERIADIAVTCDDVNAVRDVALAAGGTVTRSARGYPVVSGIGDVTYTLLPAGARSDLPGDGRNWVPNTPQAEQPDPDGPDHMTLRLDLEFPDKHAAFYRDVLDVASPSPVSAATRAGTDVLALQSASGHVSVVLVAGDRIG